MTSNNASQKKKNKLGTIAWGEESDASKMAREGWKSSSSFRSGVNVDPRMPTWTAPQMHTKITQDLGLNVGALKLTFSSSHSAMGPQSNNLFSNLNTKSTQPLIEVVQNVQATTAVAEPEASELPADSPAPEYDYFQPMLAHFSETKTPLELKQCVQIVLESLVEEGVIDFYAEKSFVFAGRAFGEYGDCEYRITIFADSAHKSVVEIRRSCGEAFTFANAESKILTSLKKSGAIEKYEQNNSSVSDSSEESNTGFGQFCFGMLPNYENVEFELPDDLPRYQLKYSYDANESSAAGNDEQKNEAASNVEEEKEVVNDDEDADLYLKCALSVDSVQDEWRFDVVHLKQEMDKNPKIYAAMDNITPRLLQSIGSQNFDAFVTRTILQCIGMLLAQGAVMPADFADSIKEVQARWLVVVENTISEQLSFKFAPSQQVVKECTSILQAFAQQQ
jgi:hypothetical protein